MKFKKFTPEDALRLSRKKEVDTSGLSPGNARIVKETRFTAKEVNRAYAEAKKALEE